MRTVPPEAPPTYFRLSEDSKARVVAEYLSGRTAKQVGRKWRVSAGTVYRWALAAGCNKRAEGDRVARASAAAEEAAESARAERTYQPPPPLAPEVSPGCEGDAYALADAALRGVAEAMRQERLDEAKTLMQLADGLSRIGERAGDGRLEIILRALEEPEFRRQLFSLIGDEHNPVKREYWRWEGERKAEEAFNRATAEKLLEVLRERAADNGGEAGADGA